MIDESRPETAFAVTRHGQIEYFKNDAPIGRSLAEYGEWAEVEIRLLCSFIGLGSSVIDVGANVGTHSIEFARRVGPTGSVLAFEPQPAVFSLLSRNLVAAGCVNARSVQAGVGAAENRMFLPPVDYLAHANIGAVQLLSSATDNAEGFIPIVAIDDYKLAACHLVKIDAEGMDADVLAGMVSTLNRHRPVVAAECTTVAQGAALMGAHNWTDYKVFLIRTAAFNPTNFRGNGNNFFGVAHESSLIFVPNEVLDHVPESQSGAEIIPVTDLDALAVAVLETPRFGDETLYDRKASQLRDMLTASVDEQRSRLHTLEIELKSSKEATAREIERLEFRAASVTQQLRIAEARQTNPSDDALRVLQTVNDAKDDTLRALQTLNDAKIEEVRAIHNSRSWRLTAPLRKIKATLTGSGFSHAEKSKP